MEIQTKQKVAFEWLTEHSRDFLEAGYLAGAKGVRIAEREEEILGIDD